MAVDLLFSRVPATGPPWDLLFGQLAGPAPSRDFDLDGAFDGLVFESVIRDIRNLTLDGEFAPLEVEISAYYDRRVVWNLHGQVASSHQPAASARPATDLAWQKSSQRREAMELKHETCKHAFRDTTLAHSTTVKVPAENGLRWQTADHRRAERGAGHQTAVPLRFTAAAGYQRAAFLRYVAASRMQTGINRRSPTLSLWQVAERKRAPRIESPFKASKFRIGRQADVMPWQTARHPPNGKEPIVVVPPFDPCYLPDPNLLFDAPWSSDSGLVFICERHGPGPNPGTPQYIIPLLRVYMSTHALSCVLLPSLEPVTLADATVSADDDGFAWSISATGPVHLLDQLAPVSGLPARIRLTVDGFEWVFAVEGLARTRAFGQQRVQIKGRSVTALLGEPYMPAANHLNAIDRTAQQLLVDALEFSGVDLGWQIPDWLVPAGVWSHQGTPLSAIMRVAESVGAVVRSSRTAAQLTLAPRYAAMPWEWPAATADVQMPLAVVTTDSLEPATRPAYNAVYVSGQNQGVLGHVRRSGTAGDLLAPMATDELITHAIAARERGRSVLGAGGKQTSVTLSMPVLSGGTLPGVLQQGQLIEVVEPGESWRGLVRGVSLRATLPAVRQTLRVERHA